MTSRRPDELARDADAPVLPPSWVESERFVPRAFVQPALDFLRQEASSGVLMLVAAVAALVWANTVWGDAYFAFFDTEIEIAFGAHTLEHLSHLTVREWINDGLMAVFFFVVGLEIKRELTVGELRDPRSAALPAIAALGGMVVPALIYLSLNAGTDASAGWGIPMATDIAFAAGVASMLGRRVPVQAKLLLLALAIVDDLGAILVIALFYSKELSFTWLGVATATLAVVYLARRWNIRHLGVYSVMGVVVWVAVLESGVHATVAGVALALITPVTSYYDPTKFPDRASRLAQQARGHLPAGGSSPHELGHHTLQRIQSIMDDLQRLSRNSVPPVHRLEHLLSPWTSFVIVPVFAFANAGLRIDASALGEAVVNPVFLGVALGLLAGKVAGVSLAAWVAVRLGIARLPERTTWGHVVGVGFLAGIGFTVALFVASLAFPPGSAAADQAKLGIFSASIIAGGLAWLWLQLFTSREADGLVGHQEVPAATAHATRAPRSSRPGGHRPKGNVRQRS